MKKYFKIYIPVIVALLISSCESVVDNVEIPEAKPSMVLFSFISPEDSTISVRITESKPVYGPVNRTSGNLDNVTVRITSGSGQSVILPYDMSTATYRISATTYPVVPGETYTITAVNPTYSVKASCRVPYVVVPFKEVKYVKLGSGTGQADIPNYRYDMKWDDVGGEKSYYRTEVDYPGGSRVDTDMHDDYNRDGKEISASVEDYSYFGGTGTTLDVYLLHTDEHYYEYHVRRINYYGDDPFSEPFPQYSNVEGGLGVFCSYRKTKVVLTVNP